MFVHYCRSILAYTAWHNELLLIDLKLPIPMATILMKNQLVKYSTWLHLLKYEDSVLVYNNNGKLLGFWATEKQSNLKMSPWSSFRFRLIY